MNIQSETKPYASVFADACFTISGIDTPQCDVDILRYDTGRKLGTKRFRGIESCTVNVAPYMRPQFDIRPMNDFFTGVHPSGRAVSCAIMCEEIMSEHVILTAASTELSVKKLLSDITSPRTIGRGEWDELSFIAPFALIEMNITMSGALADASVTFSGEQLGEDMITAVVCTDDIAEMFAEQTGKQPEELECFTVEITADYTHVATVHYLVEDSDKGMRLGWVNRYGCMDYFSFPIICSRSLSVEKSRILTEKGTRTIGISQRESSVISSGYRPSDDIRAIAAILASPSVWQTDCGMLSRMEITTATVENMRYGEPMEVKITLNRAQAPVPQIMR